MANGNEDLQEFGWEPELDEGQDDLSEFGWEPETSEAEEYSAAEAAGLGALEGGTLGLADEIGAAGQALYGELTGRGDITEEDMREAGIDPEDFPELAQKKSLLDRYREIRDLAREGYKEAQEQQPGAYFAGSMVGGAAVPGMGAVRGTRAASKAYKAARLAGKSPKAARQIAGLKALGKASQVGAVAGAGVGVGISEADLTEGEVGDFAGDVAESAAIGATLAGPGVAGVKGAGKAMKGIGKATKELPIIKQFRTGFKEGVRGKKLYTEEGRELAENELFETAEEIGESYTEELGRQSGLKRQILEEAEGEVDYKKIASQLKKDTEEVAKTGIGPMTTSDVKTLTKLSRDLSGKAIDKRLITRMTNPNIKQATKQRIEKTLQRSGVDDKIIDKIKKGTISEAEIDELVRKPKAPKVAEDVNRFLKEYTVVGDDSLKTKRGRQAALDAVYGLKEEVANATGDKREALEAANKRISQLMQAKGLLKTDNPTYEEINVVKNIEAVSDMLTRGMEPGSAGRKSRNRMKKVAKALEKSNPELAETVVKKIREGTDLTQALMESGADLSGFWQAFTSKFPSMVGNMLGYQVASGKEEVKEYVKNVAGDKASELHTQIRGMVQHAIPEDLQNMSQKFYDAGEEQIGNAFRKASGMKNERRRQAILMGLMQQPKVREILKDEELGEFEDEQ